MANKKIITPNLVKFYLKFVERAFFENQLFVTPNFVNSFLKFIKRLLFGARHLIIVASEKTLIS